jgi:Rrf2 family protein
MNSFFRVSERNHLGMILMTELAKEKQDDFIGLPLIAERMHAPLGYLEEVALTLKEARLIEGRRGRTGGYRLAKHPSTITIDQVLTALEGPITLVPCQDKTTICPAETGCSSRSLWHRVQKELMTTLKGTTLADLS